MKKILVLSLAMFCAAVCMAQTTKRMPLPKLTFDNDAQTALYKHASSLYNKGEQLGFESEYLDTCWVNHQKERMGAAFIQYLVWMNDSDIESFPCKDIASVGKAFLDNYMKEIDRKVPVTYPSSFKAYKRLVDSFLEPVYHAMTDGAQIDMNQYESADNDMSQFLGILKQHLLSSRFKSSKLKAALDAEADAWIQFRGSASNLFYQHKCNINGGIGYSMLPLEVGGMLTYADRVRDSSLSVLYAISMEDPGAVYCLSEEDLSAVPLFFGAKMEEDKTDISFFEKAFNGFMDKRREVSELLPEGLRDIYQKDTQRYLRILLRIMASEDDCF